MIKTFFYPFAFVLTLSMAACSEEPLIDNYPKEQVVPGEQEENTNTPKEIVNIEDSENKSHEGEVIGDESAGVRMDDLNFTKFELEINYGILDFDFEYEQLHKNGDYKAELVDRIHKKNLKGVEAFNAIHNLFKGDVLHANLTKEETIQTVLNAFQLDDDYTKFELEYTLKSGQKIEKEDKR